MNIDFDFIGKLEGGQVLAGYVPDANASKSGVTIATGFDLGQRSIAEVQYAFDNELYSKLHKYIGLTGNAAVKALDDWPLVITKEQAKCIDEFSHTKSKQRLAMTYLRDSGIPIESQPAQCQTVMASVAFQYGDLSRKCPKFWAMCIKRNWHGALKELRDFGDRYPTRRNKEADYLEAIL